MPLSRRSPAALLAILLVAAALAACSADGPFAIKATGNLPASSSFTLDAETSGGAEVLVYGFEVRTSGAASGGTLQGTVGTDGSSITLRTSNKSIEVSALP